MRKKYSLLKKILKVVSVSCILLLIPVKYGICQSWLKLYGGNYYVWGDHIFEHYDKGILISGTEYSNGFHHYGWALKTDINGNKLWEKAFGDNSTNTYLNSSRLTTDGGLIMVGFTTVSVHSQSPVVIKLNACGEKEWCRIYPSTNFNCFALDVINHPVGGYVVLVHDWKSNPDVWLFRIDSLGFLIWQKHYVKNANVFFSPDAQSILCMKDTTFLITGNSYTPDSLYPGQRLLKLFFSKINMIGDTLFEKPWGYNTGQITDGPLSIENNHHEIYTCGRRARDNPPWGDAPCLFKTSASGNPVFYRDLKSGTERGMAPTISWLQDSTMVLGESWAINNIDSTSFVRTDTLGNILNSKIIELNAELGFRYSSVTRDNKFLSIGSAYISGYLKALIIKLNSNLEYDSDYTREFTYDSLCPHPIASDTVTLNSCSLVTSVYDPEKDASKSKMNIYPNPAQEKLSIEFPQYLVTSSKRSGITTNTVFYQWVNTTLEVYALNSSQMLRMDIPKSQAQLELDISAWPKGLYYFRLLYNNNTFAGEKVIIQ